jgi:hypothetical protein
MSNSGCNKGTDPNVIKIVPKKKAPKHNFGDLNPKVKPKTSGKSFDTKRNTSIDVLKDVARSHLTDTSIPAGRMVGIVLRKLTDSELFNEVGSPSFMNSGLVQDQILKLKGYKIRVPELDAHLPEPETFDTGDPNQAAAHSSIINSHKTYVSKSEDCIEPTIGSLVWVELDNNVGFYLEPLTSGTSMPATKQEPDRVGSSKKAFSGLKPKVSLSGPLPAESTPPPVTPYRFHKIVKVKADRFNPSVFKVFGGYSSTKLRDDAAIAYKSLRAEINSLGGIMTTSGGVRYPAASKKSASRSETSIHYTGLAFDLGMWTGMNIGRISNKKKTIIVNPDKNTLPYVIERVGRRNWNVWCRTENPNVPVRKLKAYYFPHKQETVEGRFIDFTAIAKKHGFTGIGERSDFRKNTYTCAEWWHFNYLVPLVKGRDTFGSILEELWRDKVLKQFPGYAAYGSRVWGERWRG